MSVRRAATHLIAYSVGFWSAVALQFAYDHAINAPVVNIRRLHR
jgi:hypothetical protein